MKNTMYVSPFKWFLIPMGYIFIAVGLVALVQAIFQYLESGLSGFDRTWFILSSLLIIHLGVMATNFFPDIEVTRGGLRVLTFGFQWRFVPWESVTGMRELERRWGPSIGTLVMTNKQVLTFVHCLTVFALAGIATRGFIIYSGIRKYEELIETIQTKLEE